MPTVAQAIVDQLAAWSVPHVFGVPGDSLLPLLDALAARPEVRFVAARHEEGAALMASAHAKLSGGIGVCFAHSGPGAAHLVNGLYDAHKDRVPVLALTGQVPTAQVGTDAKQAADPNLMFAGCTSYSRQVASAQAAPALLASALRHAVANGGVAHLAIPADILGEDCTPLPPGPCDPYLTAASLADPEALTAAADVLTHAQRPVILMGRGARAAASEVLKLATQLGSPVIPSLFAKGAVPEDHPFVVGPVGDAGTDAAAEAARSADAFLVAGCTWWPAAYMPPGAKVVQIDLRPTVIGEGNPLTVGIASRCEEALPALALRMGGVPRAPWFSPASTPVPPAMPPPAVPIHPERVMAALRAAVPEDAVIAVDTGLVTLWFGRAYACRRETVLVSGRWRTMGFALPAAIAAALGQPRRTVVALCGDGGLGMSLPEFATAVGHKTPVVCVVLNNGTLGEELAKQTQAGYRPFAMELTPIDFAGFARACGGEGVRIQAEDELVPVLRRACTAGRPWLVDVPTAYAPVPALAPH